MRRVRVLLLTACVAAGLAGCDKAGGDQGAAGAGSPGPGDGVWSEREALEGPMAIWGPAGAAAGREVLSITCLPRPRRTLVVTLFGPKPGAPPLTGELTIAADRNVLKTLLSPKDHGAAEGRAPATDALIAAWESARALSFSVAASPGAGARTGAADAPLKRVLASCR